MGYRSSSVLLLFFVGAAFGGRAQAVGNITGAPFTATWVTKTESTTGTEIATTDVARSSNGSVYRAHQQDGKARWIEIIDVPNERRISLTMATNRCTVTPLRGPQSCAVRTVAQQRAVLERFQVSIEKGFDRKGPEISKHETALGTRVEDGMTVLGQHYVHTRNSDGSIVSDGDTWQTDLGFVVSQTFREIERKRTSTSELKDIHRVEPDSKLFQLPEACMLPDVNH